MCPIQHVIKACRHQVPRCHLKKAAEIDTCLQKGIPYTQLGGKRVRCRDDLIRFKIGRNWRLLYRIDDQGLEAFRLVLRQQFERSLKRR